MTINFAKIILLYTAGLILFLHSAIPHWHQGDPAIDGREITLETAESIMDYIQIMFLVDLGEGHMDNFHSGDGPADSVTDYKALFAPDLSLLFENSLLSTESERSSKIIPWDLLQPPNRSVSIPILRGPPSSIG